MKIESIISAIKHRQPQPGPASHYHVNNGSERANEETDIHYSHQNSDLGISFIVKRVPQDSLQVMDPRLVRIAPGFSNERHRHAHESIFIVLSGQGEILVGQEIVPLTKGDVVCVARWVIHQSRNTSEQDDLVILAITDFGLTSGVLGNYDARTRLKSSGADAFSTTDRSAAQLS